MTLAEVLAATGVPEAEELLAPHWEQSQASQPAGVPDFLRPEVAAEYRSYAGLPDELDAALTSVAEAVGASAPLTALAWHCRQLLYEYRDYPAHSVPRWPALAQALGDNHGLFYVLVGLNTVPLAQAYHRRLGIPDAVTRRSVSQHAVLNHLRFDSVRGCWNARPQFLYWTRRHAWGELLGVGRFEYMVRPFGGCVHAYRHRASRRLVALAAEGTRFSSEGMIDDDATTPAMAAGFTAHLAVTGDSVTGHYVSPRGQATGEILTLPLHEWEPALSPGDPMLETHIPAGGGMTPDLVSDTMRRALDFFPRYLPERPFRGFCCASWILNPDLAALLGPESNMVRWQQEVYLFPWPSGRRDGLAAAYGEEEPTDLATAPRDTRLRRAMLDHLDHGGRLRTGGMFLLAEDLGHPERHG